MNASEPSAANRAGFISATISFLAAVLSSACCWAPLLAIALGTSAAGFAATFAPLRSYFLALAALSLAVSFYLLFIKPGRGKTCAPGSTCETPRPKLRRFQVGMFLASALMTAAFAFFPNYLGVLLGSGDPIPQASGSSLPVAVYQVDGMTCKSCTTLLAESLEDLPGVTAAHVDYDLKRASIQLEQPLSETLSGAISGVFKENDFTGTQVK